MRNRYGWSASFGGWENWLFGDAHGADGVRFSTRTKAVNRRWLDPSHGGPNLGFPQNNRRGPVTQGLRGGRADGNAVPRPIVRSERDQYRSALR